MSPAAILLGLSLNALLIITVLVIAGIVLTHFARILGIQGLELWLPLGLIVSYAAGPIAGVATALAILIPSFILRRFSIKHLVFIVVSMAVTFYIATVIVLGAATFTAAFVGLTALYSVISGVFYRLEKGPLLDNVKFGLLSVTSAWAVFGTIGQDLVNLISNGKSPALLLKVLMKLF